jgi:hypothetical protein
MPATRIITEVSHSADSIEEAMAEGIRNAGAAPGVESVRVKEVEVLFKSGQIAGYRVTMEATYADEVERTPEDKRIGLQEASQLVRQHVLLEALTQGELDKSERFLNITPAEKGSGSSDVSVNHDWYLSED